MNNFHKYVTIPATIIANLAVGSLGFAGSSQTPLEAIRAEFSNRPAVTRYTVQPGDELGKIAESFGYINSSDFIARFNGLKDKNSIKAGQELLIIPKEYVPEATKELDEAGIKISGGLEDRISYEGNGRRAQTPSKKVQDDVGKIVADFKEGMGVKATPDYNAQLKTELELQAIASHAGYKHPVIDLDPSKIRVAVRGSKPTTINPAEDASISAQIREQHPQVGEYAPERGLWGEDNATAVAEVKAAATTTQPLEAYEVPRGLFGFGQLTPRVTGFRDGKRTKLEDFFGANFANLPQLMEDNNFYRLGEGNGYGVFMEPKDDRIDVTVKSTAMLMTNPQTIKNAVIKVMKDNDMSFTRDFVGNVKRGGSFGSRLDNIGRTIGPVDIWSAESSKDVVPEDTNEDLSLKFKKNPGKISGGDGSGNSGGGGSGSSGGSGPGGNSGGSGGQSNLELPKDQKIMVAKAQNMRNHQNHNMMVQRNSNFKGRRA